MRFMAVAAGEGGGQMTGRQGGRRQFIVGGKWPFDFDMHALLVLAL